MRWILKDKPRNGLYKKVTKFILLPRILQNYNSKKDELRWLTKSTIKYKYYDGIWYAKYWMD